MHIGWNISGIISKAKLNLSKMKKVLGKAFTSQNPAVNVEIIKFYCDISRRWSKLYVFWEPDGINYIYWFTIVDLVDSALG